MEDSRRIYRSATKEDKEKVLNIVDSIYDGRDYLPHLYNDVINSKDKKGYVCEEDGEIIGFSMAFIVDGGETVVRRAGRVRPEQQGKGVYRNLVKHLMDDCATISTVKHIAIAVTDDHVPRIMNLVKRSNYKHIYTANVLAYDFNLEDGNNLNGMETDSENVIINHIEEERMVEIFKNRKLCNYYFPEGVVFSEFIPLKPIAANIKTLINDKTFVLETRKKNDKTGENECRLLTLAVFYPCKKGLAYHIFINGKNTEDFGLHFSNHLQKIATMTKGIVSSLVSISCETDANSIKETYARYSIRNRTVPFSNFQVFLGENILI